ncbi:MAG: hypothetical protein QMC95_12895 [Desulfitobacteriaceae bacterium]|nr:hypothetical protein [Desulfitobacteriaceae bacterium]MDI6880399.1 hypothetical protein [Desulfitobacteriaceae bacterium]MDI6915096.1 hypothetical protein [Desulfitobacteriaceae bacterium]
MNVKTIIQKWMAIILGGFLLGLGADLDFGVAFAFGGTVVFFVAALLTAVWLWYLSFRSSRTPRELWISIFKGLAVESLLFPVASLILGLAYPQSLSPGITLKTLMIYSALVGGILAATFMFNAHILAMRPKVRLQAKDGLAKGSDHSKTKPKTEENE